MPHRDTEMQVQTAVPYSFASNRISTSMIRQFASFVIIRTVCTLLSYACYILLLVWLRYEAAYVVSYLLGIALAYVSSALFVFKQPMRRASALIFPVVYLVQFLFGLVLLKLSVESFGIREELAFAISVLIPLPLTFVMSRWVMRVGGNAASP
ncbi:GtrA family protein [Lysobacter sp. S4-A87]|uniref:GtrA family protein n=1 Tax=Lysobacter sp. S4-A87 TaxID=2925843 RepID=UPI001F530B5A|nr:GtrA family protein [Lysobacter sp. S4-A87]UNK48887.1 GtrA family protein [Lysobacter sp. S4-A87]